MIKRSMLLVIGILLMTALSSAQETPQWSAYLFDNINYDLIRVSHDGTTEAFSLGLSDNEYLSQNEITISHDGQLVAYCKTSRDQGNDLKILVIREIETGNNLHEITFGTHPACAATAFSEDDTWIALSLVHRNAFDTTGGDAPFWSLRFINVETGATDESRILEETDEMMPEFVLFGEDIPLMAHIEQFDDEHIVFLGYPYVGMGGPSHVPAFDWNFADKTVTELSLEYGRIGNDFLPETGELVYPALDESLEAAQPDGPLALANVVNVQDADGTVNTIYHNEEWVIVNTTFINDGQSIAVLLLAGFEPGMSPDKTNDLRIDIIDRDGTVTVLDREFDDALWLENAPGGMAIFFTPNPSADFNGTQILLWNGSELELVAEYLPDYSNGWSPPQLIWVTPFTVDETLPAFTAGVGR